MLSAEKATHKPHRILPIHSLTDAISGLKSKAKIIIPEMNSDESERDRAPKVN
jgi:hypothetical protein